MPGAHFLKRWVVYKYQIGDKTYVQKKLVLGQWRQLLDLLKGLSIPQDLGAREIVPVFGDKLSHALAIVLTEEGKHVRNKDMIALASELEFAIEPEMVLQVVEDFFDCNPIPSLLKRMSGIMGKISGKVGATGSKMSASSSPTETSPNGTPSSGDIPLQNANPISVLASVT